MYIFKRIYCINANQKYLMYERARTEQGLHHFQSVSEYVSFQVLKSYRKKKRRGKKSVEKCLYGKRDIASKKPLLSPIPELPEVSEMTALADCTQRTCSGASLRLSLFSFTHSMYHVLTLTFSHSRLFKKKKKRSCSL